MTAAADTTTHTDDAVAKTLLAALDPGTFGPTTADSRPMTVREHTLSRAENHLQDALVLFEQTGERGLADNLNGLIDQVIDRMGEIAQEASAA